MASANLFQQYLQPVRSVTDYSADLDKQDANRLALIASERQNRQADEADVSENKLKALFADPSNRAADGSIDINKIATAYGGTDPSGAMKLQAAALAAQKERGAMGLQAAQAAEANSKTTHQQLVDHAQDIFRVDSPQAAEAYIRRGAPLHGATPEQTEQEVQRTLAEINATPDGLTKWKTNLAAAAIPALDRYKEEQNNARNAATNATSVTNNRNTQAAEDRRSAASVGATIAGQKLTDKRERELAANKGLSGDQSKALLFGSRVKAANRIMDDLSGKGVNIPSITKAAGEGVPLIGGALGAAANALVASPDQQSLEQAQRDFVNATLRRESGAAISPSEFDSARKQYFPQIGDGPAVIAQKKANRELAMRGLLQEVPAAQRDSIDAPAAAVAGGANADLHAQAQAIISGKK